MKFTVLEKQLIATEKMSKDSKAMIDGDNEGNMAFMGWGILLIIVLLVWRLIFR